jgi:2,3-dihydroxybenzoate-AMP ligase
MTVLDGFVPFPEHLAASYRAAGYWRGEHLADLLRAHVDSDRPAIITPTKRWTYAELDQAAAGLASGFLERGLAPGDRVVVQLPNIPEFVTVSVALFRLGALPIYALPKHRRHELQHLVQSSDARALIIVDRDDSFDYRVLAREVLASSSSLQHVYVVGEGAEFVPLCDVSAKARDLPPPAPSDVAFFLLSGGTTGQPKLIPRTHDDYCYQLRATCQALEVDRHSVYLAALPIAHNAALGCPGILGTLAAGGSVVLTPSLSPDQYLPLIRREGVTFTTLMPPVALLWLELAPLFGADVSNVLLQVGGAPISPHNVRRLVGELGAKLSHWFGMAEGILIHTRLDDPLELIERSVGRPLCEADEVRVVDDHGNDVPPDQEGELWARGPYTIQGYYRAAEYNTSAFSHGFLHSGDLARMDAQGNVAITGRSKDVIIRGGEKISAEELEHLIGKLPAVRELAVVGHTDPSVGERICAYVVANGDCPALHELRAYLLAQGVADYKLPDRVFAVAELPRTSVGKVDKRRLRALGA